MLRMKLINRGTEGELQIVGRLDAITAEKAEKALLDMTERFDSLILDVGELEYVSSAGLRTLKRVHIAMRRKGGTLAVKNASRQIMEVFEITGFTRVFKFI